jgi:predicted dehydrogenase
MRSRKIPLRIAFLILCQALFLYGGESLSEIKVMVLDPGHFHAALVQKEMYPELSKRVYVYAPVGGDVLDYLNRVTAFNLRKKDPTSWEIELHASPDFLERMLRERPGNVVILAGRNLPKIDRIKASIDAGLPVLADKPWIIRPADFQKLSKVLDEAEQKKVAAYDIMTERYEVTSILQRELVNDTAVFGTLLPGTEAQPTISARSVHNLMKVVAGIPIRRPAWFFDVDEYGEGLADVGTHVVDLVQWTAFPDKALDYRKDVQVLSGKHWPTVISKAQFQRVTGEEDFPRQLAGHVKSGSLEYLCNNSVQYTLGGIHVGLSILWNWEAPEGAGDFYEAAFRGSKARIELRQGKEQHYIPELYVVPNSGSGQDAVFENLKQKIAALQSLYPGLAIEQHADEARLVIPERFRVGHEEHFAQVTRRFFEYVKAPQTLPSWEKSNMLMKYFITTKGVELAR